MATFNRFVVGILLLSATFGPSPIVAAPSSACVVDASVRYQTIRGFGGSSAWHGQLTTAEADTLFTTLGLSILRLRIDPDGLWTEEIANAQKAHARGALVFASPWSPPAWMKDNGSVVNGSLRPEHYGDYVNWLNSFAAQIPGLYAISIQNEPNLQPSYESCSWTESQLFDFIVNFGHLINTRLMMPETFNFLPSYVDSILSHPTGAANTDVCAYHWYGANRNQLWTQCHNLGKDIWMTEVFSDDQTIAGALATAVEIHKQLTINLANAYVWWWVREPSCNLIEPGGAVVNRRGYVMGQFAKFVRPGSVRVSASGGASGLSISAYDRAGKLVIVAINGGSKPVQQAFTLRNVTATSLTPYTTSAVKGMEAGAPIAVAGGSFTAALDAKSVTTFVQD